jgi:hypothetical protein
MKMASAENGQQALRLKLYVKSSGSNLNGLKRVALNNVLAAAMAIEIGMWRNRQ